MGYASGLWPFLATKTSLSWVLSSVTRIEPEDLAYRSMLSTESRTSLRPSLIFTFSDS